MNKKIYLLLTVLLAWSFNLKAQTAQIESLTANPGDPVSFDITLGNIPTTVGAVSLFIGYDPNVLSYTGFEPGTTDFTGFIINNMSGSNQIGIQWTDTDGDSDINGVILALEFQYNNLGGSCDLTFNPGCEFTNVDFTSIVVGFTNGNVGPNAGIPTVTIDELVAPPGPVSLGITGNGFTEDAGAITLYIEFDETVMQYVDFATTLDEALLFVNGNNSTGVISITYTNLDGDDLNTEFLTLNFNFDGTDVTEVVFLTGSEIANTLTFPMAVSFDNGQVTPEATAFTMWIENKVSTPGNVTGIEVYANGYDGVYDMGAVTLNIGFNPAHLTFINITEGTLTGATAYLSGPGLISIVWTNFTPGFSFDGTLLTLNFDYHFGASPVTFQGGCDVVDMGLNFIPTTYTDGSIAPVTGGPEVYLPSISGTVGQTIDFPITAKNFGLWEPAAVSMFIGYDNAVLTYTGFTEGILSGVFVNAMPGSQIGIQWVNLGGIPVADDDVLITLSFTYIGGEGAVTFNGGCEFAEFDFDIIPVSYFDGGMITGTLFDLKVFLEGPFNGTTMNTYLNSGGLLPLSQPYSGAPWNYAGTESVTSIPNANVVDWVLLEFRDAPGDANTAFCSTIVAYQAAFLLNDGSIVGLDGLSEVVIPYAFSNNIYVVVYHRNHIRVMSSTALTQIGGVYSYDFTDAQAKAYDSQQKAIGSVFGMYAADIDNDGDVFSNDINLMLIDYPSFGVYLNSDLDLDGNVYSGDLNLLLLNYPIFTEIPCAEVIYTAFNIKAFLEGPFNGTTMNTYLNSGGLLPLSQPYSGAPWNYAGTESVGTIPNANVVDWVLVEIRETTGDVESATSATMVAQLAGFLLDDGSIVGLDGSSNILAPTSFTDNIYVVVYHRNHIRVMSSTALTQIGGVYTYDFTDAQSKAYDSQQKAIGSVFGMYAGDIDNDGEVFSNDLDLILYDYPSFGVYLNSDLDLDGEVFSADLDVILYNYPLFTSIP